MVNRVQVLKFLGLGIGCVAKFTTGSLFVFAVYQNAIKDTFNYTQTEGMCFFMIPYEVLPAPTMLLDKTCAKT